MERKEPSRLLVLLYLFSALDLVAAGSLVNSHSAQLSVPDWPLSYGRLLLTSWPGNTFYEQHHRSLAALTAVLALWTWWAARRSTDRRLARRLAQLLFAQILLGGFVVLALNPPIVGTVHVFVAQLFTAGVVVLTLRRCVSEPRRRGLADLSLRSVRRLPWLLALQIALGAISWHPPLGRIAGGVTLLAHSLLGPTLVGVAVTAAILLMRRRHSPSGTLLLVLAVAQLVAGVAVFLISPDAFTPEWPPPPGFPTWHAIHQVLAASVFGTAIFLACPVAANDRQGEASSAGGSPESR